MYFQSKENFEDFIDQRVRWMYLHSPYIEQVLLVLSIVIIIGGAKQAGG